MDEPLFKHLLFNPHVAVVLGHTTWSREAVMSVSFLLSRRVRAVMSR
jgi:hypothetical protein